MLVRLPVYANMEEARKISTAIAATTSAIRWVWKVTFLGKMSLPSLRKKSIRAPVGQKNRHQARGMNIDKRRNAADITITPLDADANRNSVKGSALVTSMVDPNKAMPNTKSMTLVRVWLKMVVTLLGNSNFLGFIFPNNSCEAPKGQT